MTAYRVVDRRVIARRRRVTLVQETRQRETGGTGFAYLVLDERTGSQRQVGRAEGLRIIEAADQLPLKEVG